MSVSVSYHYPSVILPLWASVTAMHLVVCCFQHCPGGVELPDHSPPGTPRSGVEHKPPPSYSGLLSLTCITGACGPDFRTKLLPWSC